VADTGTLTREAVVAATAAGQAAYERGDPVTTCPDAHDSPLGVLWVRGYTDGQLAAAGWA